MRRKEYALYKGDKFIDIGTAKELSKLINVKPRTIQFYATPTQIKRYENIKDKYNKSYICIKLD